MKTTPRVARGTIALISLAVAALIVPTGASAIGTAVPPAQEPSEAVPLPQREVARLDGVRLVISLDGPLVAGNPPTVRTRVTNVSGKPIWWSGGTGALAVRAEMTEIEWRLGEPLVDLPGAGEPGFPGRQDLKNDVAMYAAELARRIVLPLETVSVTGIKDTFNNKPKRIPPGKSIEVIKTWDGSASIGLDQEETAGLPPSGPITVSATAHYRLRPDGRQQKTTAAIETEIVGGWDDRLHPMEAIDAALADPGFQRLMDEADFGRDDVGHVSYDIEVDRWYVGSCGFDDETGGTYWRLVGVDPFDGEILERVESDGDGTCAALSWDLPDVSGAGS